VPTFAKFHPARSPRAASRPDVEAACRGTMVVGAGGNHRRTGSADADEQRHRRAADTSSFTVERRAKASTDITCGIGRPSRGHRPNAALRRSALDGRKSTADIGRKRRQFAEGGAREVHRERMRAYKCSPSFHWAKEARRRDDRLVPARQLGGARLKSSSSSRWRINGPSKY